MTFIVISQKPLIHNQRIKAEVPRALRSKHIHVISKQRFQTGGNRNHICWRSRVIELWTAWVRPTADTPSTPVWKQPNNKRRHDGCNQKQSEQQKQIKPHMRQQSPHGFSFQHYWSCLQVSPPAVPLLFFPSLWESLQPQTHTFVWLWTQLSWVNELVGCRLWRTDPDEETCLSSSKKKILPATILFGVRMLKNEKTKSTYLILIKTDKWNT